jgi:ribosome maturation factor RimP
MEEIQQKIEALAKKVIEAANMELIDLKVVGHPNDVFIQITADKPSGSINIQECAILNKLLVAAIEQENVLPPENFSLELSSPGLDRPLVTRKDFMRYVGHELHFWLNEKVNGKKEAQGILKEVSELSLTINSSGKSTLVLPLALIVKGMLVI